MQSLKLPFAIPRSLSQFFTFGIAPFKDARDYQILFLSVFLLLGVSTRDWSLKPIAIALTFYRLGVGIITGIIFGLLFAIMCSVVCSIPTWDLGLINHACLLIQNLLIQIA